MRTTSNKPVPLVAVLKVELWGMEFFTPLLSSRRIHPSPCKGKNKWNSIFKVPPFSILTETMSGALRQSYSQELIPINSMEKTADVKEYCCMSYLLILTLW